MENIQTDSGLEEKLTSGCINCGSVAVVKGYPNALCEDCRNTFIKFPVPTWIKLFAAGIAIIFLLSVYKIPGNIMLGVHLEKGKTAMEEKKYFTAQKELQKVVDKIPNNLDAKSNLAICAFKNQDYEKFSLLMKELGGVNYEDNELFNKINKTVEEANDSYPSDAVIALQHRYNDDFRKIPDTALNNFLNNNKTDIFFETAFASKLFDKEKLKEADSLLTNVLHLQPDYIPAIEIMTSLKRQEGQLDSSIIFCDKLLGINKELIFAMASKARTLLKQKKDNEAAALAHQSYNMNNEDLYATGSLVLVYHFANKLNERDALLKKLTDSKDSSVLQSVKFLKDVISGKENFRN